MFCKNCGREIASDISFCPSCGTPVPKPEPVNYQPNTGFESGANTAEAQNPTTDNQYMPNMSKSACSPIKKDPMATASMILGIVSLSIFFVGFISIPCGIVGLILSIISYKNSSGFKPNKDKATAGIICSCIGLALSIVFLLFVFIVVEEVIKHSDEIGEYARQFKYQFPDNDYYQFSYDRFTY